MDGGDLAIVFAVHLNSAGGKSCSPTADSVDPLTVVCGEVCGELAAFGRHRSNGSRVSTCADAETEEVVAFGHNVAVSLRIARVDGIVETQIATTFKALAAALVATAHDVGCLRFYVEFEAGREAHTQLSANVNLADEVRISTLLVVGSEVKTCECAKANGVVRVVSLSQRS